MHRNMLLGIAALLLAAPAVSAEDFPFLFKRFEPRNNKESMIITPRKDIDFKLKIIHPRKDIDYVCTLINPNRNSFAIGRPKFLPKDQKQDFLKPFNFDFKIQPENR
jgi:hypothetical protein